MVHLQITLIIPLSVKSKWQNLVKGFNVITKNYVLWNPIFSPVCVREDVSQLREALQNRGPQHGELFTSTQKQDLFPVGKCYSISSALVQILIWERVEKHLCTINSKLYLRNRGASWCLFVHLLQESTYLKKNFSKDIDTVMHVSHWFQLTIKWKQSPLKHRKQENFTWE